MSSKGDEQGAVPVDLVFSGEVELDAAPHDVWPYVLDYASWQNFPVARRIGGEAGQEGELVLLQAEEDGHTIGPFYGRTIKLEAERRIVWKMYVDPQQGVGWIEGALDFSGTVDFRLEPSGEGRTTIHWNNIYEYRVTDRGPEATDAWRRRQQEETEAALAAVWPRLKQLVESPNRSSDPTEISVP
jgi:Polyketide cyclase / dehydrase and lipid transport